jgi:hypothetical protein
MGLARLAVKRSPFLSSLVEIVLAVEIVMAVFEGIVKTRGGGGA